MFDKALVEEFNDCFSGNQMPEIIRIKSEVELIGYNDFAELTWSQIQDFPEGEEQDRIFKNAIFVVIQDIRFDDDESALRLLLLALGYWEAWDRSLNEFSSKGLLQFNSLINEALHYSLEDGGVEGYEPAHPEGWIGLFSDVVRAECALLEALQKGSEVNKNFVWDCEIGEAVDDIAVTTLFGDSARSLIPNFDGKHFSKVLFFVLHLRAEQMFIDERLGGEEFNRLVSVFFADEIKALEVTGEIELFASDKEYSFNSIKQLVKTALSIFEKWGIFSEEEWSALGSLVNSMKGT